MVETGIIPTSSSSTAGGRHRRGAARIHRPHRHAAARRPDFRAQRADRHRRCASASSIGGAGKIVTAFDMARAWRSGADWCNAARGFMFALGCIQSLSCHTDRCPTGVATQDPTAPKRAGRARQGRAGAPLPRLDAACARRARRRRRARPAAGLPAGPFFPPDQRDRVDDLRRTLPGAQARRIPPGLHDKRWRDSLGYGAGELLAPAFDSGTLQFPPSPRSDRRGNSDGRRLPAAGAEACSARPAVEPFRSASRSSAGKGNVLDGGPGAFELSEVPHR